MFTVVGLGNPGTQYEHTRHNAGASLVRALQDSLGFPTFVMSSKLGGEVSEGMLQGEETRLFIPSTFMNTSGKVVARAVDAPEYLVLVTDELDLPLGTFKISYDSGSGGHNGVRSVTEALGTKNFVRVRIGISPTSLFGGLKKIPKDRVADFVLKPFSPGEMKKIKALTPDIIAAIRTIVTEGKEKAMNRYN